MQPYTRSRRGIGGIVDDRDGFDGLQRRDHIAARPRNPEELDTRALGEWIERGSGQLDDERW